MHIGAELRHFVERHGIAGPVVVACSGGGDSTALLIAFTDLGLERCEQLDVELDVAGGTLDPDAVRHRDFRGRRLAALAAFARTSPPPTRRTIRPRPDLPPAEHYRPDCG